MQQIKQIIVKNVIELNELIKEECMLRGYSHKTIICYQSQTKIFLSYSDNKLKQEYTKKFISYLRNKGYKITSTNNAISALKFVFKECLKQKIISDFPSKAKIPSTMPQVLNREKILQMINTVKRTTKEYTLKHRLIIEMIYSSGLRLSELINLKVGNIDFYHKRIFVREGKGAKDRITIVSEMALKDIQEYIKVRRHQSNPYLFDKGTAYHISGRTVWKVLQRQARECCIAQNVHPHLLRDSFATHLLESGVDSRYIQRLLGHARLETTTKYTRVADVNLMAIKSPLDLPT